VLWQLDTGRQQFLPHMSSTIQNLVVSPSGTSYAIQLAENSALVLSTAELKPTVNIAGIQSCVVEFGSSASSYIKRTQEDTREFALLQHTPAVVSPSSPSRLLLSVGQTQEVSSHKMPVIGTPFLQTFDLGTGYNVSRQALTRSNITNVNITPNSHQITEPRVIHMKLSFNGEWLVTVDEWVPTKQDLDYTGYQGIDVEAERWSRREVFLKFWQWSANTETWELVSRINAPHTVGSSGAAGRVLGLAAHPTTLCFSTIGEDKIVRTWATKIRKRDGVVIYAENGTSLRNWHCIHAIPLAKPEPYDADNPQTPLSNGSVSFSEDGSILAAACGGNNNGLLYLFNPDTGALRLTLNGMYEGDIIKIEFLGQDLVTLSDRILVYDLVLDQMRYSFELGSAVTSLSIEQKIEMMQLAVDGRSRTFAVAVPGVATKPSKLPKFSEIAVFHQDQHMPLLKERLPTLVTALLPTVDSEGYLVLDSAAEIRTVLKKGSQAITVLAKSTSVLRLDKVDEAASSLITQVDRGEEMELDELPAAIHPTDDANLPVVTQQKLTEVFDTGPSFALPSMEDMFYQVVDLFSA
jgi:NET1-associated nuclear protein 1 (U3 small nucleolar RNA-associated protein 17)